MKYYNVIDNIYKLMKFWDLTLNDIAKQTGISLTGIKKMFKLGSFKLENLEKIAEVLKVDMFVLLADRLKITNEMLKNNEDDFATIEVEVIYDGRFGIETTHMDAKAKINIFVTEPSEVRWFKFKYDEIEKLRAGDRDKIEKLEFEVKYKSEMLELISREVKDKSEILEFIKRENLFAFSNIIRLLMENRQGIDGGIAPEKLNDLTWSKIHDESFLKTLLDNRLITESDYQFFIISKNAPGTP